jgi:hypothetical protein
MSIANTTVEDPSHVGCFTRQLVNISFQKGTVPLETFHLLQQAKVNGAGIAAASKDLV